MAQPALAVPLRTERFDLIPLGGWQAASLTWHHWVCDPQMHEPLLITPKHRRRLRWWRRMLKGYGHKRIVHTITPHGAAAPIGLHQYALRPWRTAGLLIALHDRDWWGKDVVLEVRRAMIGHIFESGQADRIETMVLARNVSSIYTYRRLGFTHAGTAHRAVELPDGSGGADIVTFEMLRENWQQEGTT